jgi:uncharacterized protein YqeY
MQPQIEKDLRAAMIAGEKDKVETLKVIKSALQYEAVAKNVKPEELSDEQAQAVLAREAKKRVEAAELYEKAGESERAAKEKAEKVLIDGYLPAQMDPAELEAIVQDEIAKAGDVSIKDMGRIIGAVRARTGAGADGSTIAQLVKKALEPA